MTGSQLENFKESIFEAVDLQNIVWIDDRFHDTAQNVIDDYYDEIEAIIASESLDRIIDYEPFSELDFSRPFQVLKEELPSELEIVHGFYKHIGRNISDLMKSEFDDVIDVLKRSAKGSVHKFSGQEWDQSKASFIQSGEANLYLVDYNFEHEGRPNDYGKSLLVEILTASSLGLSHCVLFTSETQHGKDEESKRKEIALELAANDESINCNNFSVLSKSIVSRESGDVVELDFKLAEFLKRVFLRRLSGDMVESLSQHLEEAIGHIRNGLSQNSIYEIQEGAFDSLLGEGKSELEFLFRLISIQQTEVINRSLHSNELLIDKLKKFRQFQRIDFIRDDEHNQFAAYREYIDALTQRGASPFFKALRASEVFDDSVNFACRPLSCGDIFEVEESKYVLIEQECDLIVRGAGYSLGSRKVNQVLLVPYIEERLNQRSRHKREREDKYYLIKKPDFQSLDNYCVFDFSKAFSINVNLLDLVVFDLNGEAKFRADKTQPELLFLPGWVERFKGIKSKLVDENSNKIKDVVDLPVEFSGVSLDGHCPVSITADEDCFYVNIKRVSRLKSPFVTDLSKSYYIGYKARTAFERDFG